MREIKFRGKNINDNIWRYGYLVRGSVNSHSKIIDYGIKEPGYYPSEVFKETVGQFTGLKDENNVEIYESDVIKMVSYVVGLEDFKGVLKFEDGSFWVDSGTDAKLLFEEGYDLFVLGNIYENPELLEVL